MKTTRIVVAAIVMLGAWPASARADLTAFWGAAPGQTAAAASRGTQGFAIGMGLLVVGIEFDYANTSGTDLAGAPGLRTGMFNGLVQTPTKHQLYATMGGGLYRQTAPSHNTTSMATNIGGGIKIGLAGPVRIRLDYRIFSLRGDPLYKTEQRFYAGVNIKF